MHDVHLLKELIEKHTAYSYIGDGAYLMGVPARDLTEGDLAEILEREGLTREDVEASGLYERLEQVEVEPFCGAELDGGRRCRRKVGRWGERCYQHEEVRDDA